MPYNSNERLEREARESLVASDLSAKMKQWRNTPPEGGNRGNGAPLRILLVLLALGGAAWLFWPKAEKGNPLPPQEQPSELLPPVQQTVPPAQEPIAQKPAQSSNRYLALAQSNYRAPDFDTEIRSGTPPGQNVLNDARRALAEHRYADALNALQNDSPEYKTDVAYLRGHALFSLKKYAQAAAVFGQLTGSIRYGEAAQWYEVLALLPDFEQVKPNAMKKLKKIVDDEGHTFQQEASRLISQI